MFTVLSKGNQLFLEAGTSQSLLSVQAFCFSVTFLLQYSTFSLFIGSFISACSDSCSLQTKNSPFTPDHPLATTSVQAYSSVHKSCMYSSSSLHCFPFCPQPALFGFFPRTKIAVIRLSVVFMVSDKVVIF